MVVDRMLVDPARAGDRRPKRVLPNRGAIIGIEGEDLVRHRSRVRPPGKATPGTIRGWASAPRRSPGNGRENSRRMPRLRTAAAASTLSAGFAPSRLLL